MSRLKREGNPPSGQLASPVPQAWDPSINDFREITGQSLGDGRFGADGLQWGKTAGGLYLPIKVDNEGRQEVTLSGTLPLLRAKDPATGDPVEVSAVQDNLGNWVLRVVKAAEVAYDDVRDAFRVEDVGKGRASVIYAFTLSPGEAGAYFGKNKGGYNTTEVIDLTGLKSVKIAVKNNSTDLVVRILEVRLTTNNEGVASEPSDYTTGHIRAVYRYPAAGLDFNAIPAGETKYFELDELVNLGTPHNTSDGERMFVEGARGGFIFSVGAHSSLTEDDFIEVVIIGVV